MMVPGVEIQKLAAAFPQERGRFYELLLEHSDQLYSIDYSLSRTVGGYPSARYLRRRTEATAYIRRPLPVSRRRPTP